MTARYLDPLRFNARDESGQYLCPACGLAGYFEGYSFDKRGGVIATGICPCCFYEPGFDDDTGASAGAKETVLESILDYRRRWIEAGMPWLGEPERFEPLPAWNPARQLEHLFVVEPALK